LCKIVQKKVTFKFYYLVVLEQKKGERNANDESVLPKQVEMARSVRGKKINYFLDRQPFRDSQINPADAPTSQL